MSLQNIEKAIKAELVNQAKTWVNVGKLLADSQNDSSFVLDDKFNGKAWLAWVEMAFDIKKAQAYALIKVAKVFGGKRKFESIPMGILSRMASNTKMANDAEKALDEGIKIDNKWMKAWLEAQRTPSKQDKTAGSESGNEDSSESGNDKREHETMQAQLKKRIAELEAENMALRAENAKLREWQEEHSAQEGQDAEEEDKAEAVQSDEVKAAWSFLRKAQAAMKASRTGFFHYYGKNAKTIKQAIKRATSTFHPDKVAHLNNAELTAAYNAFVQEIK